MVKNSATKTSTTAAAASGITGVMTGTAHAATEAT